MSITRRNSSGVSRVAGTAVPMPALLISTSTRAQLARPPRSTTRVQSSGTRDVGGDGEAAAPERAHLLGGLLQAVGAAGADRDVGARLGEAGRRTRRRGRRRRR